jgi:type II secretion system protein H
MMGACGSQGWSRQAAFTLIEIIVVITVIAILAGVVALSTSNSPARDLKEEAERFNAFVRLLQDESVLMGKEYGLFLYSDGLRVLEWYESAEEAVNEAADAAEEGDINIPASIEAAEQKPVPGYWQPIQSHQFKFEHEFPEFVEIVAWVEGAELDLVELEQDEAFLADFKEAMDAGKTTPELLNMQRKASQLEPTLLFLSSGEATAYRIRIAWAENPEQRFEIVSDVVGNISFVKPGENYEGG